MDINDYRYVAHRGLFDNKNKIPENSLLAFSEAIEKGYAIEFDVHLTKDLNIVVYHDSNLEKLTGLNKEIEACTLNELKQLKLLDTNLLIPTLDELLELVDAKVPLLIEIKNEKIVGPLEKLLMKRLEKYNGKYVIESFNPLSISWVKNHYKNVAVGQLLVGEGHFFREYITKVLDLFIKPEFIAYDINHLTKLQRKYCDEKNIYLLSWTIRNKEELEKARTLSDGIIFEITEDENLL